MYANGKAGDDPAQCLEAVDPIASKAIPSNRKSLFALPSSRREQSDTAARTSSAGLCRRITFANPNSVRLFRDLDIHSQCEVSNLLFIAADVSSWTCVLPNHTFLLASPHEVQICVLEMISNKEI